MAKILMFAVILGSLFLVQPIQAASDDTALIKSAESAIRDRVNDPNSAIFRDEFVHHNAPDSVIVCGKFNSKNAYGGYGNFEAFAYFIGKISNSQIAAMSIPLSTEGGKLITGTDEANAWVQAGANMSGPLSADAFSFDKICGK